jgi:hypothetical protein
VGPSSGFHDVEGASAGDEGPDVGLLAVQRGGVGEDACPRRVAPEDVRLASFALGEGWCRISHFVIMDFTYPFTEISMTELT